MENELLKKMLEAAMHSKSDPRLNRSNILINNEDKEAAQVAQKSMKKRQCANCTCSLSKNKPVDTDNIKVDTVNKLGKSSCGSCNLGDAFRCPGCPYKGMPAFEEGKEFNFEDTLNDI